MKIRTIVFSLFIVLGSVSIAQETLESAFEKSYSYEKAGNFTSAISIIKSVYAPGNYEVNLRLGYLYYSSGQYSEAMNYYAKSIALCPHAIEPKMGLVYPASMLGKWDEVVKQYLDILRVDPKNSNVNYKLGLIYYNRKNYPASLKYFDAVVDLYPFDYDGLLMLGWSDLQMGKIKEARGCFNKVLLLSPRDKSALEGLNLIK